MNKYQLINQLYDIADRLNIIAKHLTNPDAYHAPADSIKDLADRLNQLSGEQNGIHG